MNKKRERVGAVISKESAAEGLGAIVLHYDQDSQVYSKRGVQNFKREHFQAVNSRKSSSDSLYKQALGLAKGREEVMGVCFTRKCLLFTHKKRQVS